jgi:hypothetical protein
VPTPPDSASHSATFRDAVTWMTCGSRTWTDAIRRKRRAWTAESQGPPSPGWSGWPRSGGRIEHDYQELKTGLGLDHFEGRSFAGWHRRVTLAALAQAFWTLSRP